MVSVPSAVAEVVAAVKSVIVSTAGCRSVALRIVVLVVAMLVAAITLVAMSLAVAAPLTLEMVLHGWRIESINLSVIMF
jgi:hypothetical protein